MTERVGLEVDTLTIRIPVRLQRRGGRKLIMTPEGATMPTPKPRRDDTLIKALVRAHRWRRRIESGRAKSITDLAEHEGVTDAYICRLLPLTCLAPDWAAPTRSANVGSSAQRRLEESTYRRPGIAETEEASHARLWTGVSFVCSCALGLTRRHLLSQV
jgi:hypothetical protein